MDLRFKRILSFTIVNRLFLFFVSWLALLYFPVRARPGISELRAFPDFPFLEGWTRWDGGWYVSIATQGYYFNPLEQSNVAFFPLYPLSIKLFMLLFKNPYLSGIIVSNLAFLTGVTFFYKLLKEHIVKDEEKSFWSILFLISFPYSFFFSAVYSESLFFMCAVICFYFAERKKWLFSSLFGMLACADRFVGIALFSAILVKYWETYSADYRFNTIQNHTPLQQRLPHALPVLSICLIPAGLIGYMAFLYIKFSDPLAFAHTIGGGWEGMKTLKPDILLPFKSFVHTITNFSQLPDNKYHVLFQFPIFLFFLLLIIFTFKHFSISYGIFSLAMLLIPSSVSIDLISMGRYLLVIFPCFSVMPYIIRGTYIRVALITLSFLFLTLFTAMFSNWWWVG
jgi:hypothetical protein